MTETHFEIRAKAPKLETMLEQSAIPQSGDPPYIHSEVLLDVEDGEVSVIQGSGGGSVLTYTSWDSSYFNDVSGGGQALLNVDRTLDYLSVASDGGRLLAKFEGPEDSVLAQKLETEGAVDAGYYLPANESDLQDVPREFPERFNDEEQFLSPSGNPHKARVNTTVSEVLRIIEAVELNDEMDFYPVAVKDGEFFLDVTSDSTQDYIRGPLTASNVEGPDFSNWYDPGFVPLFEKTLSGDVELQTTPGENGGHNLAVVQEFDTHTTRHVLVEVNPA